MENKEVRYSMLVLLLCSLQQAVLPARWGSSLHTFPHIPPKGTMHAVLPGSPGTPLQSHGDEKLPINTQTSRGSTSVASQELPEVQVSFWMCEQHQHKET